MKWYDNLDNVCLMARKMHDAGDSVENILYMLEKPWKWNIEWRALQRGENPFDPEWIQPEFDKYV